MCLIPSLVELPTDIVARRLRKQLRAYEFRHTRNGSLSTASVPVSPQLLLPWAALTEKDQSL